jgi:non-ribosomal peptide synthetase component F
MSGFRAPSHPLHDWTPGWYDGVANAERANRLGGLDSWYDQSVRCGVGPRLDRLFEAACDLLSARGQSGQLAVDSPYAVLTYQELDCLAKQLARYLLARGARSGDRIGLLLDHGVDSYVAMLAVLKIQAAYVPLNPGIPADRLGHIAADAGVLLLVSATSLAHRLPESGSWGTEVVFFDAEADEIGCYDGTRLDEFEHGGPVDDLAYLIYPSGSTGRPNAMATTHATICSLVLRAAKSCGISAGDRVYEGLSAAFDFSSEGIWATWMVGASLVPKSAGPSLAGQELRQFLTTNHVTALFCVPTLLATLGEELPELRSVLVSGETCPSDLLGRWHRPDRRLLSMCGRTEASLPAATMSVQATADMIQVSNGQVTVHMTPGEYERTPDDQLRRLLID